MSKDDKPDAWMPLYIGDWDGDTGHLSNEQDGMYGRLVRWYWRKGPLPDDDAMLASVVRVDVKTWRKQRAVLASFFTVADGFWRHGRVDEELIKWGAKKVKAHARAQAAAEARWAKNTPEKPPPKRARRNATSIASSSHQALLDQCPSSSSSKVEGSKRPSTLTEREDARLRQERIAHLTLDQLREQISEETAQLAEKELAPCPLSA